MVVSGPEGPSFHVRRDWLRPITPSPKSVMEDLDMLHQVRETRGRTFTSTAGSKALSQHIKGNEIQYEFSF